MLDAASSSPRAVPRRHALALIGVAVVLMSALAWHGPIPQWASYHDFADARAWFGLPNAQNVLSNLPFAWVGLWALRRQWRRRGAASGGSGGAARSSVVAWACFGVALVCTAFGSGLYHAAPGNDLLVLDRLPIAWACAALSCAFLCERVDPRWATPPTLAAAGLLATASVLWWWFGERLGHGDLRAYLFVQFLPMLMIPTAIGLKLPPRSAQAVDDRTWWIVLGLYGGAKLFELADDRLFDLLQVTSGHTLKHLAAAAAAWVLLRAALRPAQLR
jgi:hypothetical protein